MQPLPKSEFDALAATGVNRIPLVKELLADLDTPLSVYLKLANTPYSYLFESVQGGEKWGRYSVIGLSADTRIKVYGQQIILEQDGREQRQTIQDPLQYIDDYLKTFKVAELPALPRFNGGLVGYFGYDTVRYIEPKLATCPNPDQLNNPDILLMLSENLVVFDNLLSRLLVIVHVDPERNDAYAKGIATLNALTEKMAHQQIEADVQYPAKNEHSEIHEFTSQFTQDAYLQAVEQARQYIIRGDAMQIVLSQRLSIPFQIPPINLYRALRHLNPSPYLFYMHMEDHYVVGASPEILVRLEMGKITVRPIAGTRPRGQSVEEDEQLAAELLADPKECAEHLMLLDLGRNDVGRVSKIGQVQLTDKMIIERYSHVMHIVSNVEGMLCPELSALDVLRATFPAGTVSGAPKIRAMEIIDELESVKRGIYAGAIGYLGWNGNMDTTIAIRTAAIKDNTLYVQAGAGIVYDSIPNNEWEETMNKGRAVFRAVRMAESGLYK